MQRNWHNKKPFGTWQFGRIGVLIISLIWKKKNTHLLCVKKSEVIERKWETYNPDHREDLFNDKVMTNHVNSMSKVWDIQWYLHGSILNWEAKQFSSSLIMGLLFQLSHCEYLDFFSPIPCNHRLAPRSFLLNFLVFFA